MSGRVRTNERCPKCNGKFQSIKHPLTKDIIDLMCASCLTRPSRFYIDGRSVGDRTGKIGRIFRDKSGRPFDSFLSAHRTLETIRQQIDTKTFDPSKWSPAALAERTVEKEWERWVETLFSDRSVQYARKAKYFGKKHLIPFMGTMDVRDVRALHIEGFYRHLQGKGTLSNTSLDSYFDVVKGFFGRLSRLDVIPKKPDFPKISREMKDRTYIDRETQEAVLMHINPRAHLPLRIMIETGCRPAEACAVRVKDLVDGKLVLQRSVTYQGVLKETKKKQVFSKVVSPALYADLEAAAVGKFPDDFLARNRWGNVYRTPRLSILWREAAAKVGPHIPNLYVAMRHSKISQLRDEIEKELTARVLGVLENSPEVARVHYLQPKRKERKAEEIVTGLSLATRQPAPRLK